MKYFNIVPKRSNLLLNVKKDIRNGSIVSCCHFFVVACVVILSNPWPSDFRGEPSMDPRTTNGPEAFHRDFNSQFYTCHPHCFAIIYILLEVQEESYLKIGSIKRNVKNKKRKEDIDNITYVLNKFEEYKVDKDVAIYLSLIGPIFTDPGLNILLYCMMYLFVINLLNGIFLYDEHQESTDINKEFGPVFNTCKLIRHTIFWIFGCYAHGQVISLGVQKLHIAIHFQLNDLFTRRICFLVWSALSFLIDVYWIIKTCVYQQIIDAMEPTTRN